MQVLNRITITKDLGALQITFIGAFHLRITEFGDVEQNLVLAYLLVQAAKYPFHRKMFKNEEAFIFFVQQLRGTDG
jgi:hypothetical protein